MDQNTELTLKLKAIDLDKVLVGLSKLPYEVVFELLADLRNQGIAQLNPPVEAPKE